MDIDLLQILVIITLATVAGSLALMIADIISASREMERVEAREDIKRILGYMEQPGEFNKTTLTLSTGSGVLLAYDCKSLAEEGELEIKNAQGETETLSDDVLASVQERCDTESKREVIVVDWSDPEEGNIEYVVENIKTKMDVEASIALGPGGRSIIFEKVGGLGENKKIVLTEGEAFE